MKNGTYVAALAAILFAIASSSPNETIAQSQQRGSATKAGTKMKPVAFESGVAKLTPQNSKIEFIGIHVGDKPDPRLGGFRKFEGNLKLGPDKSVESLSLSIDVNSVWTQFDKLTNHLKNSDFFETEKFGNAKFVSTKISADASGMKVTGNLTLHGETKEITLPAKGTIDASGVVMITEFQLDRTMFGMNEMTSGVDKMVAVKFVVGQPTQTPKSMPGPGTKKKEGSESKGSSKKTPELTMVKLTAPHML